MAIGRSRAVALLGLGGRVVEVEADLTAGLPAFVLTGLPDASLGEARDRVRAALRNAGLGLPDRRVVVNLVPASLPKSGTGFDLAVAAALLAASGWVPPSRAAGAVHVGELGLDGRVRGVRGVLPAALAARDAGHERLVVAEADAAEAVLVPGLEVVAVRDLPALVRALGGPPPGWDLRPSPAAPTSSAGGAPSSAPGEGGPPAAAGPPAPAPDLADVAGQADARAALEVAAAGGHHLLLLGPPGAGKSMLAARLPALLPDLAPQEALEATAVHSVAGTLPAAHRLLVRPPFEDPHHTASAAAVLGGGSGLPVPGAASRAHRGVLLLDEAPEFTRGVLDGLRQPLEGGELVIARSRGTARFPARFQLVLTANPCPCGTSAGRGDRCGCSSRVRRDYLGRLSGPLLDRVDLQVLVDAPTRADLAAGGGEATAPVAARVAAARTAARERLAGSGWATNAEVPGAVLRAPTGAWALPAATTAPLAQALEAGELTVRGVDRTLRMAWTLADLSGRVRPGLEDVLRASVLRLGDRAAA